MDATVQISLVELDKLRETARRAEDTAWKLDEEVRKAERRGVESATEAVPAVELAIQLVQFATANLPPETSPGWPYQALKGFGEAVQGLAGLSVHAKEAGADFITRAAEIEPFEVFRAAMPKKATIALPGDYGPQTDEARAAHEAFIQRR